MWQSTAVEINDEKAPKTSKTPNSPFTGKVFSNDGTSIEFDRVGHGPSVILVDGALCYRSMGESGKLARLLAPHFTVFTYDRRGRGTSGDTAPYAVEREVEDLAALLREAGGSALLWGTSSGAVIALQAAGRLLGIQKLALYEAPFIVDNSRSSTGDGWDRINAALAAGERSDAVKQFLKLVGVPGFLRALLPFTPMWSKLKSVAHTIPYDGALVRDNQRGKPLSASQWASVTIPVLVMDGGKSPKWMRNANRSLASVLPNAQYLTLEGQTHMLSPKVHAPILVDFFKN